ncbi:MAG: hypothetical protein OBKJMPBA_00016 [Methanophagales virus PBV304]|uniref:Uncharacterized protein n=1 Tax=Methanophagales virus PBV304 TaxID=3071309 RepID=A0AA46YJC5_9VIRU|nr:MAG: hypothetical protein QIT47_gp16 [Methanophagales virus PBV304]UYL65048.1 MAG: hypothetical protein OBKJMPBA_00016 [Methanophagales virus PBV304]
MRREYARKKIRSIREMREFIIDAMIEHAERRGSAIVTQNNNMFYYEQGFLDALKTIRDLLSEEGLLMYRYVLEEKNERVEDKERDTF